MTLGIQEKILCESMFDSGRESILSASSATSGKKNLSLAKFLVSHTFFYIKPVVIMLKSSVLKTLKANGSLRHWESKCVSSEIKI